MNIYLQKKQKRLNFVSVTLALIVVVGGYLLWFWVPAYWPIFQLSGMMRGACNDAYRETDNQKVLKKLLFEARRTKLRLSKDNFRMSRRWYTDEELEKLPGGRKTDIWSLKGKACVIEMHYEDDYEWPLIGKKQHLVFEKKVDVELTPVTWNDSDGPFSDCRCVSRPRRSGPTGGGVRSPSRSL